MVACHLLKYVDYKQDAEGENLELRYFRDVDGREVDFVITRGNVPIWAIEVKWKDCDVSKSLKYLKARFPECEMWQISAVGKKEYISNNGICVMTACEFLSKLV